MHEVEVLRGKAQRINETIEAPLPGRDPIETLTSVLYTRLKNRKTAAMANSTGSASPSASDSRSAFFSASVHTSDPELALTLDRELRRQEDGIELIASENYASRAVMEAQASVHQ